MSKQTRAASRLVFIILVLLVLANLMLLLVVGWPFLEKSQQSQTTLFPTITPKTIEPTIAITIAATQAQPTEAAFPTLPSNPISTEEGLKRDGLILFSMQDANNQHLFVFHPLFMPLTRITQGNWNDITPAVNSEGNRIAFSSNRNGYYDIYIYDLVTHQISQFTDTPEYDANPTWSPDGQWIAFESYQENNLDILIKSVVDLSLDVIQLTNNSGVNHSPAWSPQGRSLAFVSDRSGDEEIWLAFLDQVDDRFVNISRSASSSELNPEWSPDGNYLSWFSNQSGENTLWLWNLQLSEKPQRPVDTGDMMAWSPRGDSLITQISGPNQSGITAYGLANNLQIFPYTRLPGRLSGIEWRSGQFVDLIRTLPALPDANKPADSLWSSALQVYPPPPSGRFGIVPLQDVSAPFAYLHDTVDESFNSLRKEVAAESGWDFLSTLENAYTPFNEPLLPGMEDNWLYTGRAIAVNPMPLNAGWMTVLREEYNGLTYWRIYIRARYQDGSQGVPLSKRPWDLNARFLGNPSDYEFGGRYAAYPNGYWIDFTEIAHRYGWQRLPAEVNWRSFYPATRFNLFILSENLDWNTAMSELYPPEALATPTFRPTYTPTITQTPENFDLFTLTPTPLPSLTPTLRPTLTPQPSS